MLKVVGTPEDEGGLKSQIGPQRQSWITGGPAWSREVG